MNNQSIFVYNRLHIIYLMNIFALQRAHEPSCDTHVLVSLFVCRLVALLAGRSVSFGLVIISY